MWYPDVLCILKSFSWPVLELKAFVQTSSSYIRFLANFFRSSVLGHCYFTTKLVCWSPLFKHNCWPLQIPYNFRYLTKLNWSACYNANIIPVFLQIVWDGMSYYQFAANLRFIGCHHLLKFWQLLHNYHISVLCVEMGLWLVSVMCCHFCRSA